MKQIFLFIIFFFVALTIDAQQYKHEIRGSFGFGDDNHLTSVQNDYRDHYHLQKDGGLIGFLLDINVSAHLEYLYHINRKIAIGGAIGIGETKGSGGGVPYDQSYEGWDAYSYVCRRFINVFFPDNIISTYSYSFHIMPEIKYTWLDNGHFALYSKGGIGIRYYKFDLDSNDTFQYPEIHEDKCKVAYQISPVGIEIGSNHLRFSSELGYGQQGIVNFGLVWHFGK